MWLGKMWRFLLSALIFLAGCAFAPPKDLVTEYKNTSRSIGVRPIYPPSEDFQVGDVFVQSVPKTEEGGLRDNADDESRTYLGTSDNIVAMAQSFMRKRIAFRKTESTSDTLASNQRDTIDGFFATRKDLELDSLPLVGFPEVTADAGDTFGLNVLRVFRALGIGAAQRTQVILNFGDVRKYGVPNTSARLQAEADFLEIIRKRIDDFFNAQPKSLRTNELKYQIADTVIGDLILNAQEADLAERARLKAAGIGDSKIEKDRNNRCLRGLVVTQVYLTRQIKYTYTNARIQSLALERISAGSVGTPTKTNTAPTPSQTNIVIAQPGQTAGENPASPITIVDPSAIRAAPVAVGDNTSAGEGLVFDSFDARGLTFRQVFDRPVAIGYEAIGVGIVAQNFLQFYGGDEKRMNPEIRESLTSCIKEL